MPRAGLDSRALVEAAVRLADRGGYSALTLKALAHALKVKPPSLYNHVSSLEALQRALMLEAFRQLYERLVHAVAGRSKAEALRHLASEWRAFAREHPGLYAATVRAPEKGDKEAKAESARVLELVRKVLSGFGRDAADTLHTARSLRAAFHGFATLEASGGFGLPLDSEQSYAHMVELLIRGLEG
jgi:AcrR family transcriptional regulator